LLDVRVPDDGKAPTGTAFPLSVDYYRGCRLELDRGSSVTTNIAAWARLDRVLNAQKLGRIEQSAALQSVYTRNPTVEPATDCDILTTGHWGWTRRDAGAKTGMAALDQHREILRTDQ
jgi:hypothetical protein